MTMWYLNFPCFIGVFFIQSRMFLITFMLFILGILNPSKGQIPVSSQFIDQLENIIENNNSANDDFIDNPEIIEDSEYLMSHPIYLNDASYYELNEIPFLNDQLINNLINYREKYGNLLSIFELHVINGFNESLIKQLLSFITLESRIRITDFSLKALYKKSRHQLILRYKQLVQKQEAYSNTNNTVLNNSSYYLGGPQKIYTRYAYKYRGKINLGFTAEKDAGEEFFKDTQKQGFDFYSAYICLKNYGIVKRLLVGDYKLQLGQGITQWSGYSTGKSPEMNTIRKYSKGIRPYTSANEYNYLRGGAISLEIKHFGLTAFYSQKKTDAEIINVNSNNETASLIKTIKETGYHRTLNEIEDKKTVKKREFGGYFSYRKNLFEAGISVINKEWNKKFHPKPELYRQFTTETKEQINVSLDYRCRLNTFYLFGEMAKTIHAGSAIIQGFIFMPDHTVSFGIIYRQYGRNYHSQSSNAFGENSTNNNEEGLFFNMSALLCHHLKLLGYCDLYRSPWLKYNADAPTTGNESYLQIEYLNNKKFSAYLRYRSKNSYSNSSHESILSELIETKKQSIRFQIKYRVNTSLTFRNRIEGLKNTTGKKNTYGCLVFQDIKFKLPDKGFSLIFRYTLFDTDTYSERIWAYENDVLYLFSIPAFYYKGSKFYVLLKTRIHKKVELWLKYAETLYVNRETIGTGPDQINGSLKSEITTQLRLKF